MSKQKQKVNKGTLRRVLELIRPYAGLVVLTLVLIATTKPLVGKGYLYPLIPFDRRKLLRLLYRRPINRHNS